MMLFLLFVSTTLTVLAQKPKIWKRFYDRCLRDEAVITTLPPQLEKDIHWSPKISKEQKDVIRYILWNMVYMEGGTMNMGENPSNQYRRDHPVDRVNWFDAQRLTEQLSKLSGLHFRLPFESEWEYAARGGNYSKNYIYADSNHPQEVAWFKEKYDTYVSKAIPFSYLKPLIHPNGR